MDADQEPAKVKYEPIEEEENTLPDNATVGEQMAHVAAAPHSFFKRLVNNFGWRFSIQLLVMYLLVKGVMNSGIYLVMLPFCQKSLGVSGEDCQTIGAIAGTPWALKGAIGVASDLVPLWGYHKIYYIVITACMGTFAVGMLATAPISSASVAALLFAGANLETATADLLHEGRYSEIMQEKPKTGSSIVSYVWGLISVGGLIASCFVGPIADAGDPRFVFFLLLPCAMSIIIPTLFNFLHDPKVAEGTSALQWHLLQGSSKYPVYLALVLAFCALFNMVLGLVFFDEKLLQMLVGLVIAAVLVLLAYVWLPPTQRACNLYMFASSMLYVNIQGALDYWYTADETCVPGGPHFNYMMYVTLAHVVASIASLLGIFIFQGFMQDWTFTSMFVITTVLQVFAASVDVLMIQRVPLALGIPDELLYMSGNAVVRPIVFMTAGLPGIVLTSRLVPPGLSATTYALLAGYQHLGHILSQQIGVVLIQTAGISTSSSSPAEGDAVACEWGNLTLLVVVCHMLLPLLTLPLVYVLIPNKTMTERVVGADMGVDESGIASFNFKSWGMGVRDSREKAGESYSLRPPPPSLDKRDE